MRILPPMWASTLWPPGISTRNIALGRVSMTEPSTSMTSSLADFPFAIPHLLALLLPRQPHSVAAAIWTRGAPPGGLLPGRLGNDVGRGLHQEGLAAPPGYDCPAWKNHAKAGERQLYHPLYHRPGPRPSIATRSAPGAFR